MTHTDPPRAFLDVTKSASGQRWVERMGPVERNTALAISQNLDLPELVGRVLAGRGVTQEEAERFLNPTIRDLMPDPAVLTDMDKATARIADAIGDGQRVAIFGDYDVDGASSSALMAKFLTHHGITNEIYIPDRIFEGYGPNPQAIKTLVDNGAELIVTVDCGATSFEALEEAAKLDTDVIVLDHHQMGDESPKCVALVNPNRQDDLSGLGHLCAAGVVFLTLVSVVRELRNRDFYKGNASPPDLLSWLDSGRTGNRLRCGAAQGAQPRVCGQGPAGDAPAEERRAEGIDASWPDGWSCSPLPSRVCTGSAHQCRWPDWRCGTWARDC